jgi:hypothetical protein
MEFILFVANISSEEILHELDFSIQNGYIVQGQSSGATRKSNYG